MRLTDPRAARLLAFLALSLGACGTTYAPSTPLPYPAQRIETEDPRQVVVVVEVSGVPLEAARESARYPGTTYCLSQFGSTDIDWTFDPKTRDWAVERTPEGYLVVNGRCAAR